MPRVRVGDVQLHYLDAGPAQGEAVLLIMGWGGDHTAWAFQIPALASRYRVIALDNRGAGQSDAPDMPYTIRGMAADALALLDALGIRRAHVCGASMGGMIAQELALAAAERVLSLQLHCTLARGDAYGALLVESLLRIRACEDAAGWARALLPWLVSRRTVAEHPEFVSLWVQRAVDNPYPTSLVGLRRQAEAVAGHDTLDRLGRIAMPTLVTTGTEDILVPPAFSREIHARIRGAEMVEIPGAGHIHFIEQAETFNAACLAFLNTVR